MVDAPLGCSHLGRYTKRGAGVGITIVLGKALEAICKPMRCSALKTWEVFQQSIRAPMALLSWSVEKKEPSMKRFPSIEKINTVTLSILELVSSPASPDKGISIW